MRCIQLAKNGLGSTYPNPMVGCVIVHSGRIIGEGWHMKAGTAHAEVIAIESVADTSLLQAATLYVSLEPCSHFGKTPPCADLIVSSGIKKVVIGGIDPNPKVAGRGIQKLMEAGCDVTVGVLNDACEALNKRFFTFHQRKRPFIVLKWAQTQDGFMAPENELRSAEKKPFWITNAYSRQFAHKMRSEEQALLVGTQTVLADNPNLTTRDWQGNSPVRVVLDRNLKIPKGASVFDGTVKTIVITEVETISTEMLHYETIDFSEDLPKQLCAILYQHKLQSVIIEGGARTLQSFIDVQLWDEAVVFTGAVIFQNGLKAPTFSGKLISEITLKEDIMHRYKTQRIDLFST